MTAHNVDFCDEIRRVAGSLGATPTAAQVADVNVLLQSAATVDTEARTVSIHDGETLDSFIRREAAGFDRSAPAPAPATPTDDTLRLGSSTTFGRTDPLAQAIRKGQAAETAATRAEAAKWPNPWRTGPSLNRTRQAIVTNVDPALAAKLKAEAGIHP